MIKLATIFSGIGAVEQALKRMNVDHQIIFACDNGEIEINYNIIEERNKIAQFKTNLEKKKYVDELYRSKSRKQNYVKQSYLANYDIDENAFYYDVKLFDGTGYKNQVDLLVGGSPCQSFSSIGFQGGLEDARGTLFYDYARIIKEVQPKVFIYENVRGLTTHDGGNTWRTIQRIFKKDLHYRITDPQILNAADYGIPQNRRRLFVVGIREDLKCEEFSYPQPIGVDKLSFFMQDILEENCKYDENTYNYFYDYNGKIAINKVQGPTPQKYILTPKVETYVLTPGTRKFRTSIQTDLPIARTLLKTMTQHHRAGVDNYVSCIKPNGTKGLRSLSPRECLRLMGYPDSFKIVVSDIQMLRQAGNSIVVDVMMFLLQSIIDTGIFE